MSERARQVVPATGTQEVNVLLEIVAQTRSALAGRRAERPLRDVVAAGEQRSLSGDRRSLRGALSLAGLSLIAEPKRR